MVVGLVSEMLGRVGIDDLLHTISHDRSNVRPYGTRISLSVAMLVWAKMDTQTTPDSGHMFTACRADVSVVHTRAVVDVSASLVYVIGRV